MKSDLQEIASHKRQYLFPVFYHPIAPTHHSSRQRLHPRCTLSLSLPSHGAGSIRAWRLFVTGLPVLCESPAVGGSRCGTSCEPGKMEAQNKRFPSLLPCAASGSAAPA